MKKQLLILILTSFSVVAQARERLFPLSFGMGASFYLGKHENAKVKPSWSYSLESGFLIQIKDKYKLGFLFGYSADFQQIESTSKFSDLQYLRKMEYFHLAPTLCYHTNSKTLLLIGIEARTLFRGFLIPDNNLKANEFSISRAELNTGYLRTLTPSIRITALYELFKKNGFEIAAGGSLMLSLASVDFQAQPGTLNQFQLKIVGVLCDH